MTQACLLTTGQGRGGSSWILVGWLGWCGAEGTYSPSTVWKKGVTTLPLLLHGCKISVNKSGSRLYVSHRTVQMITVVEPVCLCFFNAFRLRKFDPTGICQVCFEYWTQRIKGILKKFKELHVELKPICKKTSLCKNRVFPILVLELAELAWIRLIHLITHGYWNWLSMDR